MAETQDTGYLSIGEVLGLLLEEFPEVTISKIRFLESQGLIAPERTASGYRKFYEHDIELLRVILREQRENYLPLRVIKDRIDAGVIDPSGEMPKPGREGNGTHPDARHADGDVAVDAAGDVDAESGDVDADDVEEVPHASIAAHPAARRPPQATASTAAAASAATAATTATTGAAPGAAGAAGSADTDDDHTPVVPQLLPGVVLDRSELCAMTGVTPAELAQLEEFGIVAGRGSGGTMLFNDDAVETAKVAVAFLRAGVDARHLRSWRTSAEREASLYEQLVTPRLRQRNPESRADALRQLKQLDELGGKLRTAMVRTALRHLTDG